jgi:uncharacterized SAM-binding protein YcdF (DUF218 family)
MLTHMLESRFPQWIRARADGVVLGGAISPRLSRDYGEPVLGRDADRVIAMAKLARAFPNTRIIYSGGDASLFGTGTPETDFVYPLLDSLGVLRERVLLKSRSRNTAENAAFTKICRSQTDERWLLVTSACTCRARSATRRVVSFEAYRRLALKESVTDVWRCHAGLAG